LYMKICITYNVLDSLLLTVSLIHYICIRLTIVIISGGKEKYSPEPVSHVLKAMTKVSDNIFLVDLGLPG